MAAGLVLGPCPATLFGICRPVNEINYQPTHSYLLHDMARPKEDIVSQANKNHYTCTQQC